MFDELKNSWKNQSARDLPSIEELESSVQQGRAKMVAKLMGAVIAIGLAIISFILIWYFIPFKYAMTQYSMLAMGIIMGIAIAYMLYLRNQIPSAEEATIDTSKYIQLWVNYRERLKTFSKSFISIYFLVITGGMAIYLYEITEGNTAFAIIAYSSVLLWILIVWFYLKPKWEKSTDEKIQKIIDNYKSIASQLNG